MEYLRFFESHEDYASEGIDVAPCVIFDNEHIHYIDETPLKTKIATFILASEGITSIASSEDLYEFKDINLNSSDLSEDGFIPYIIYPTTTQDFSVIVSIDNVETYKLSSDGYYEINDDLLDSMGGESSPLYQYKGQNISVPQTKRYGFVYDGVEYWRTGSSASLKEYESSETMIHLYNYKSVDGVNMWITNNYNSEKLVDGTISNTVSYHYESGTQYTGAGTEITVTAISKL